MPLILEEPVANEDFIGFPLSKWLDYLPTLTGFRQPRDQNDWNVKIHKMKNTINNTMKKPLIVM